MTLNEMKAELVEMEIRAAEMAPYFDDRLLKRIDEMKDLIVEWEAELAKTPS